MSIPETQFETWSKQGATASATAIYDRIKRALKADPRLLSRDFEVFLQGSYRNSTNIHGDSDVDVVVKLNQTYMPDYTGVDESTKRLIESRTVPATYAFADFRKDVSAAIRAAFPNHDVTEGGKSIKIPRTSNNIPADVVPCLSYRQYFPGLGLNPERNFIDGIWLKDVKRGGTMVSFPRQHYDNGVSKHRETRSWYKPTVRIFKNARGRLEDRRIIAKGAASSHSIECLLYNVPSQLFGSTYQDTFVEVVNWLAEADMNQFVCQNGVQKLFAPGRWTTEDARSFVLGLIELWNQWSQNAQLRVG